MKQKLSDGKVVELRPLTFKDLETFEAENKQDLLSITTPPTKVTKYILTHNVSGEGYKPEDLIIGDVNLIITKVIDISGAKVPFRPEGKAKEG